MRKLIILMMLMLLLPISFTGTLKADNTLPPNPGLDDGDTDDGGDEDGDHPWGEENTIEAPDKDRNDSRVTFSIEEIIYYSFSSYFEMFYGNKFLTSIENTSGATTRVISKRERYYSSQRLSSRRDR